jgi:quercetin dioxygenase-like cupin family protein
VDVYRLEDMTKGWFAGDFAPAALSTQAFEAAVKHYPAGATEERHFHKIATEITVVISGEVMIGERRCTAGDIVVIHPGETVGFAAITDAALSVLKVPSVKGDKYSA